MHNIPVFIDETQSEEQQNQLKRVAEHWQFSVQNTLPAGLALTLEDGKLAVKDFSEAKQQGVFVDFLSGSSVYRQQHGGGKKEPIAKAVGVKGQEVPVVLDATPGLGRDAFVLASLGCRVVMMERSPVVAALLADGLHRLAEQAPELEEKFRLIHGNSIEGMNTLDEQIDVVYLDPMFPHRKKSALVKKEMRVFQQLLGSDDDADSLLAPARELAGKRVVVKRPAYAEPLADVPPAMAITSKKHRFDVYISTHQERSMINVGSTLPEVTFGLLKDGKTTNPHTNDIFGGKRVVVFAVPGAFTPTCSAAHLPGYVALADKIKAKGVDDIVCISVNDAFVMDAWGKSANAEEITMLADGNAFFTRTIGLDMNTSDFGGVRSMRYSMLVEDGEVVKLNVEDPGRFEVSDAETMLNSL